MTFLSVKKGSLLSRAGDLSVRNQLLVFSCQANLPFDLRENRANLVGCSCGVCCTAHDHVFNTVSWVQCLKRVTVLFFIGVESPLGWEPP